MIYLIKTFLTLNFIILAWFTLLQVNDPDALVWTGIYGISSLIPLLGLFNRFYKPLFWLAIFCCLAASTVEAYGAYTYLQHRHEEPLMQSMNPAKPYIEEAREFLGGLIALGLVIISGWLATRIRHTTSRS